MSRTVFVIGSNLPGYHGAGAAKYAKEHYGAMTGIGVGHVRNSYAIPTKDCKLRTLPKVIVQTYVNQFLVYARLCYCMPKNDLTFHVTRIGCGLAGFTDQEIAPMFSDASPNCQFDEKWHRWLTDLHKYWGTYP